MKGLENYLLLILDLVQEPLFILDPSEACVYSNRSFCELLGWDLVSDQPLQTDQFWPGLSGEFESQVPFETELADKADRPLSVTCELYLKTEQFRVYRVLKGANSSSTLDSFHSQRLETLGVLAGGIAHDFNNILAGILGHITYLKTILADKGSHVESLTAVEDGARKASQMTQEILDFSRLDAEEKPTRVDLPGLAESTCKLLRGAISPKFKIRWSICKEPVFILGVEAKIAQVLANLVINSRDAIERNGLIEVAVEALSASEELLPLFGTSELSAANYARIVVKDDGMGMSEEVQQRAFEPYFSTKRERGTGLGLATVKEIVESLGGVIQVRSRIEEGTEINIYLPVVELPSGAEMEGGSAEGAVELKGGDECILVVDDEYPVRNVLAMSLEHLGYDVLTASGGREAIDCFESGGGKVDLVILDMLMPEMPGEEVFKQLQRFEPAVRVLVISGYSSEDAVKRILDGGGRGFIQKPFTIEELSQKVRECLYDTQ